MAAPAPFCNVEVAKVPGNPGDAKRRGAGAGTAVKNIPAGATLQQAIRIMNENFQQIINNFGPSFPTPANPNPFNQNQNVSPGKQDWNEVTRKVAVVRVFNESDRTQFVDVEQINGLTMKNKKTGETWVWTR